MGVAVLITGWGQQKPSVVPQNEWENRVENHYINITLVLDGIRSTGGLIYLPGLVLEGFDLAAGKRWRLRGCWARKLHLVAGCILPHL